MLSLSVVFVQTKENKLLFRPLKTVTDSLNYVSIANVSVVRNMTPLVISFYILLALLSATPSLGKRCNPKSSDIVKITVRNETRGEAGKDPVEEIIELKM